VKEQNNELDPLCFKGEIAMAVTNRGHLIPCCRCDNPENMKDPEFQKLLAVSKISKENKIEDILQSKQWKRFKKNLEKNIGPFSCNFTCRKDKKDKDVQVLKKIDTKENKLLHNQRR